MSRLVARILLAILMLPMAAMVYLVSAALLMDMRGVGDVAAFFISNVVLVLFTVPYWVLLWYKSVRWTGARLAVTLAISVGCLIISVFLGIFTANVEREFGIFVGGATFVLTFLIGTVFAWRETATERAARLRGRGAEVIVCPVCSYNMTGLREPTCPECGAKFTLQELVASQPRHEAGELEAT